MQVRLLSKRERQEFISCFSSQLRSLRLDIGQKNVIREVKDGSLIVYVMEGFGTFVKVNGMLIPVLIEVSNRHILDRMPSVIVDMGAVPHIANGADVMRPGIVALEGEFCEGGLVVVRDERYRKPIAIGKALKGSEDMLRAERGKVVINLHYVGDKVWKLCSDVLSRYPV